MARKPGTYSVPARTMAAVTRLTPEEKARVQEMADRVGVTLAYALRVGLERYLEDAIAEMEERQMKLPISARKVAS